jgi:hypothetical protein
MSSWCVAVSTRNRFEDTARLLRSLAAQSLPPAAIAVVDQSHPSTVDQYVDLLNTVAPAHTKVFVAAGTRGASAGRNQAFRLLDGEAPWVATPNDTSSYEPDFGEVLCQAIERFASASCLVGSYWHAGAPVYLPGGDDGERATSWKLWKAMEAACVWNGPRVLAAGGFDETIGSGSAGRAQSGEGTDLICRLARTGNIVCVPALRTDGPTHHHDLDTLAKLAKDRGYNIGTGVVYRRYFAGPGSWLRLAWPIFDGFAQTVTRGRIEPFRLGLARSRGRTLGYLFPARSVAPDGGTNRSDQWRLGRQERHPSEFENSA